MIAIHQCLTDMQRTRTRLQTGRLNLEADNVHRDKQRYVACWLTRSRFGIIPVLVAIDVKKEINENWADWDEDDEWDPSDLTVASAAKDSEDSGEDEASQHRQPHLRWKTSQARSSQQSVEKEVREGRLGRIGR